MPDPVLHLLVGPNGAGKSTLYEVMVGPATHLEFVNADLIALERWPDEAFERSYDAAVAAAARRAELIEDRTSFVTETVFSHGSRLELVQSAADAGYLITLHVVAVPEELAVARVRARIEVGGHPVAEDRIRARFHRLWPLVGEAIGLVESAILYDNSRSKPSFRVIATFQRGLPVGAPDWPVWAPEPLREAGLSF